MLEAELAQLKGRPYIPFVDSDGEPSTPLANMLTFTPEPGAESPNIERDRPEPPNARLTSTVMYRYIFDIDDNIPASEQPKDVHLSVSCQWNRYLPQIPQLTRLEHDTILSHCFKYGVTWLHCMLPETFLHDMLYFLTSEASTAGDQLRLQHYTPMLHCALLAYGSAFSENPEIRSPSVRAEFARYAKQWLDFEFKRPVMGLVRALALLAEYHCGIGERSTGFMYMGMSIRSARSLILSDEQDSWINEGVTAHSEAAERDWHFWSAFSQDKLMALEFKQEYDVPIPHLGVSLPSIDTESDGQPWSDGLVGFPPRLITKTFFDSCKLMVISTRVISFLHDKDQESHGERAVINLHRVAPAAEDSRAKALNAASETFGQGGGNDPIHDLSVKMVDRAAHKIVQLLQMFEEQHGMRFFPRNMIHVIYDCGTVLLKEAATVPFAATKKRATALEAGNVCLRALKGASETWPWAEQLSNLLEAELNEAGANITTQPFASNWTVSAGETEPVGADSSQTFYQFVHVWDPMGVPKALGAIHRTELQEYKLPNLGLRCTPIHRGLKWDWDYRDYHPRIKALETQG
ncbi:unnamed protein product [Rhizoctonia solani]|uniref:Xylanolytic transcriptional activator regulatory domain-containing protein n=1 Tax=Rhizoctonia solani TaxID=456999 RepID=A0A8H3EAV0_9AGAM|nr:unnamed protein product [Rhizoctonia solani]